MQTSSVSTPCYSVDDKEDAPTMKCDSSNVPLKVFMYDMPPEFHFELIDWKAEGDNVWPDIKTTIPHYPGGLNLQHSIEYWLTLDLLSSTIGNQNGGRSAVRVLNSSEADVVFVPFFSSVSYNRHSKVKKPQKKSQNKLFQEKLVAYLTSQEEWKRSGGRDHIVMAHHPNSMLDARLKIWPAMFILSDFGRYPPNVANVEKDVIAPYKHVVRTFVNDSSGFEDRPTLLYFQGAIYRKDNNQISVIVFYLLKYIEMICFLKSFNMFSKHCFHIASSVCYVCIYFCKFCIHCQKHFFCIKWVAMWSVAVRGRRPRRRFDLD
ncbi:hypothetical protein ACHQM5_020080 [Ranunculus cassubicifolius]